jgi:PPOX class probable F420-dependent enzyme
MSSLPSHRDRPRMPDAYGIARDDQGMLPWDWVTGRLEQARNYWVITTRPDGRPHAAPVWGVWQDGAFLFSTDPASRKGRNFARRPEVVVHLESGDDVVIIEGVVEHLTDAAALAAYASAYEAKYGVRLDTDDTSAGNYRVRPMTVQAWREQDFPATATRWRFTG